MTGLTIVSQLALFPSALACPKTPVKQPDLHTCWQHPDLVPAFARTCAPARRLLDLLGPLHWADFPERDLLRNWGQVTIPYAALVATELLKLNEGLPSFGHLHRYLLEHEAFIWLCGFPLVPSFTTPSGFNASASLPSERHLTHLLRHLPNAALQVLLGDSVRLIGAELTARGIPWGDCISLDTKHIVARVRENNPKTSRADRYKPLQQGQATRRRSRLPTRLQAPP